MELLLQKVQLLLQGAAHVSSVPFLLSCLPPPPSKLSICPKPGSIPFRRPHSLTHSRHRLAAGASSSGTEGFLAPCAPQLLCACTTTSFPNRSSALPCSVSRLQTHTRKRCMATRHLFLVEKAAKCRADSFQTQVATTSASSVLRSVLPSARSPQKSICPRRPASRS